MCNFSHEATNFDLEPDLLERALAVSGEKSKGAAVTRALEELIARREQAGIEDLLDQLEWDADYDDKADRSRP